MQAKIASFLLALCAGLSAFPNHATAQFVDGETLKKRSDAFDHILKQRNFRDVPEASFFIGYIAGIGDSLDGVFFCIPDSSSAEELAAAVRKYVVENPGELGARGNVIVMKALSAAYGC